LREDLFTEQLREDIFTLQQHSRTLRVDNCEWPVLSSRRRIPDFLKGLLGRPHDCRHYRIREAGQDSIMRIYYITQTVFRYPWPREDPRYGGDTTSRVGR